MVAHCDRISTSGPQHCNPITQARTKLILNGHNRQSIPVNLSRIQLYEHFVAVLQYPLDIPSADA